MTNSKPTTRWQTGYALMMIPPLIGLVLIIGDPPTWLEIVGVVAIVALVFEGSRRLRNAHGGWRPSKTLPKDGADEDR